MMEQNNLLNDLFYDFPENLVALQPQKPPRVMMVDGKHPVETTFKKFLEEIPAGDVLVVNNTKVLKRRIFGAGNLEILFLSSSIERTEWDVLFPSRDLKIGDEIILPLDRKVTLIQKGRPQKIKSEIPLDDYYFEQVAELPLPPYIQKARNSRRNLSDDSYWYQTAWASIPGSLAAPTASLHFTEKDLEFLKNRGVQIETLTLHVSLGTFLPLTPENVEKGSLHKEWVEISESTWQNLLQAKKSAQKIWALGTTVTRSLESAALGKGLHFETDLFIKPGFEFKMVDVLMTNFHQPGSSLLALVMAFAGIKKVQGAYAWAIQNKFKLFSYGDFSVWKK